MNKAPPPRIDPLDTRSLVTRTSLVRDLQTLGVASGDKLLVHSSLSSLGFVVGGGRTVIDALLDAVGEEGTIIMPTYSGENSDPAEWRRPPVPPEWIDTIRKEMPAYDPLLTPARDMGSLPELFRHHPHAVRSPHPQSSFTAVGHDARAIVDEHPLDERFGPKSPLGKLYEQDGKCLLLGVSPRKCSLYYLTEHRVSRSPMVAKSAPMMCGGTKKWVSYVDHQYTGYWFIDATEHLLKQGIAAKYRIGDAECISLPARKTVQTVSEWRLENGI